MADAASRGWGKGWPRPRFDDMVRVEAGGIRVTVHRAIAPLVGHLLNETVARGYPLRPDWCWGYACRAIAGTSTASNHSWGLALDLQAPKNPMGPQLVTDMPPWMPLLWSRWGFRWGGSYDGRKDCLAGDTLIVTDDGPRPIRELAGRVVTVLSTATDPRSGQCAPEWVKAPVESFGWDTTYEVILRRRGVTTTIRATGRHRWPVRGPKGTRFVETAHLAESLRQGESIPAMTYPTAALPDLDPESVAQGIVWGDGSVYNRHGGRTPQAKVQLCGKKDQLRRWLEPLARYWRDEQAGPTAYGLPAGLKALPDPDSALAIAAGFFAGWFACDGHVRSDMPPSLSSSSTSALSWVHHVAPRLGLTITNVSVQPAGCSGFGSTKDNYTIAFREVDQRLLLRAEQREHHPGRRRWFGWTVVSIRATGLLEEVFCPTVEGRNVVAVATPSVPVLTGQSMHYEFMGTPADAANLIQDLPTEGIEEEGPMAFVAPRPQGGYIVVQPDGGVYTSQGTPFFGSVPGITPPVKLTGDVVGAAWTLSGQGYWLVDRSGAVYAFGDAPYLGGFNAEPEIVRGKRYAVGIRAFPDHGYEVVTADPSGDASAFDGYAYRP